MMKSKTTNFLLAGLLTLSVGSAFAASDTSGSGPITPQTGGAQSGSAMPPGGQPTAPSGSTSTGSDAAAPAAGAGAGKSMDGGNTGSAVGKTGGNNRNGPNGTGGGASGSDDN